METGGTTGHAAVGIPRHVHLVTPVITRTESVFCVRLCVVCRCYSFSSRSILFPLSRYQAVVINLPLAVSEKREISFSFQGQNETKISSHNKYSFFIRSTINGDRRSRIDQQPPPRSHAPLSHRPQKYSQEAEYVHRRSVSSRDVLLAGHVPSAVQVGQLPDTHFLPHTFHVCGIMRAVYYSLLSCGFTIAL